MAGVLTDIRTEHLQNTSLKQYCYTTLFWQLYEPYKHTMWGEIRPFNVEADGTALYARCFRRISDADSCAENRWLQTVDSDLSA
jgi:hypothetical protein